MSMKVGKQHRIRLTMISDIYMRDYFPPSHLLDCIASLEKDQKQVYLCVVIPRTQSFSIPPPMAGVILHLST